MEDKESGSLSQKSVLDLIVELYQGTVTGSLKLERAPLQKAVYFRDGQILFAASNDPKDQLASILVEEGKLGPDQMQVAQARVSSGNPLAKVLTELGYISQRELADAARIKVEKILTDLYSWNEGTYQFATKSLPKGAIDLDLSTTQLIFASVRRIQNRDWILAVLGSLDTVLGPSATIDEFIVESKADDAAAEVLRHANSTKSVTEIGAMSSLGEFEVCKILAAGLVTGALTKAGEAAVPAAVDDAFSIPSEAPAFDPGPPSSDVPFGGVPTVGLETNQVPPAVSDDPFQVPPQEATVFQPPPPEHEETDKTVFEAPPGIPSGLPLEPPPPPLSPPEPEQPPAMSFGAPNATASELLIDEPEPELGDEDSMSSTRMPPRPKGRQGGGSSGNLVGILKIAGVIALAAGAAFSVYFFVWPMFAGGGSDGSAATETASGTTPPPAASSTAPAAPGASPAPPAADPRATGTNPGPRPAPAQPTTEPTSEPTTEPASNATPTPPPATTSTPRGPTPPPRTPTQPTGSSGGGRQLLAGGDISGAANAFSRELGSSSRNKFTVAVGLYCNEDNVGRVVQNARGAEQLYVLPTTVQGRKCFRVVWGTFDTRQAAEQGMGSVPNGIRAGDSAAVPVASVLR